MSKNKLPEFRLARLSDLNALVEIEERSFDNDQMNRRSFRRWLKAEHGILCVVEVEEKILGYGLVWCHEGTRLARLYSIAILEEARGKGIARKLMNELERLALQKGKYFMRLEVAKQNASAISLYQSGGYKIFGEYSDYYEDHSDALRMQKTIRKANISQLNRISPWYQQTTEFTCGPAALMMAMATLEKGLKLNRRFELAIWREATTIYMTSGLGGSHPVGLAIAAEKRGFESHVYINSREPLFVDGVRTAKKKEIIEQVHNDFVQEAKKRHQIKLCYQEVTQKLIDDYLKKEYAVIALISTYRLDGKKTPHWVLITHADEDCFYVHDPDPDTELQEPMDCQYLPIAREDFEKMSCFGVGKLRTAIAIKKLQGK